MEKLFLLLRNSFMLMRWQDVVDIILLAFLVYKLFQLLKDSSAAQVIKGIIMVLILTQVVGWLQLNVTYYILSATLQIGIIALVILFQPELRRMLDTVGRSKLTNLIPSEKEDEDNKTLRTISQLVSTAADMSRSKTGMLIVIERETKLGDIMKTGTIVNADITIELLENLFFNKAPLHDGAVIIRDNRVAAAGCFLPLTDNKNLSSDLGTRHRAGVGMSEASDAVVLIVSEETGAISVAIGGILKRRLSEETLTAILTKEMMHTPQEEILKGKFRFRKRKKAPAEPAEGKERKEKW